MGILTFFTRRRGMDYLQEGINALKQDKWDHALNALQKAADHSEGMAVSDRGHMLIALSIVCAAAGDTDRATVGLVLCKRYVATGSTIAKFIDGLYSQINNDLSGLQSPFSIKGKQVAMEFVVAKEVLIRGIETGQIDPNAVLDKTVDALARGFLNR